jgi:hypothetical protein
MEYEANDAINGICEYTETCEYKANMIHVRLYLLRREQKKVANTAHPNPDVRKVQRLQCGKRIPFSDQSFNSFIIFFFMPKRSTEVSLQRPQDFFLLQSFTILDPSLRDTARD